MGAGSEARLPPAALSVAKRCRRNGGAARTPPAGRGEAGPRLPLGSRFDAARGQTKCSRYARAGLVRFCNCRSALGRPLRRSRPPCPAQRARMGGSVCRGLCISGKWRPRPPRCWAGEPVPPNGRGWAGASAEASAFLGSGARVRPGVGQVSPLRPFPASPRLRGRGRGHGGPGAPARTNGSGLSFPASRHEKGKSRAW